MIEHTEFTQNMDTLFSDLQNFTKTESILGNPLTVGDRTLVPVMSVTLGYGSAGMGTKVQQPTTSNSSSGIGLGAKIATSAVVVLETNGVSLLPVDGKSNMGQLMDKIPQAIASMSKGSGAQGQQNPLQNLAQSMSGSQQGQQGSSQNQSQASSQNTQKKL